MDGLVDHPRKASLATRDLLVAACRTGVACENGLIAHGRGEAFDYLIGERTRPFARRAARAAAALLLCARAPVISVNGNAAALSADAIVALSRATGARVEANLFYRTPRRMAAVRRALLLAGAAEVLGGAAAHETAIPELSGERRRVDRRGIAAADVVLLALEDGDRTRALRRLGKTVIAIDLNPLSVTARCADVTIVDNVVRAFPLIAGEADALARGTPAQRNRIIRGYDNRQALFEAEACIRRGAR